jgi:signal transduction histidine kinase
MKTFHLSLWARLSILVFISLGCATFLLSAFTYRTLEIELLRRSELLESQIAISKREKLNDAIERVKNVCLGFALNPSLQEFISQKDPEMQHRARSEIESLLIRLPGLSRVAVLDENYETRIGLSVQDGSIGNWKKITSEPIEAYSSMSMIPIYIQVLEENAPMEYLRLNLAINSQNRDQTHTLVFDYDMAHLLGQLNSQSETHLNAITNSQGDLLEISPNFRSEKYFPWQNVVEQHREQIARTREGSFYTEQNGNRYFIYHARIETANNPAEAITMLRASPLAGLMQPAKSVLIPNILTIVGILGATLTALLLLAARLTAPLKQLTETTQNYEPGKLVDFPEHQTRRQDEIGNLYRAFKNQSQHLNEAFAEKEAQLRELESSNRALERARDEAKAGVAAKTNFLSVMSHEIRTPLNSIIGYSQILESEDDPERCKKYLESMRNGSNRLLALVNNILDFSRLTGGKVSPRSTRIHIDSEIEDAVATHTLAAEKKGIDLILENEATEGLTAITDPVWLGQIVSNLVGNAVKFTTSGQVRLETKIISTSKNSRAFLEISCEDTGCGFQESELSRILKPFEQEDNSITRKYQGSGLGLAIVSRLLELLEGTITAESTPGKGSVFRVKLPLLNPELVDDKQAVGGSSEPPTLSNLNVFQIEDDKENARLIERFFSTYPNCTVKTAGNLDQAKAILSTRSQFDLMLLDIQLGKETSLKFLKDLKQGKVAGEKGARCPVFIVSAATDPKIMQEALELGAELYLTKPLDLKRLKDAAVIY